VTLCTPHPLPTFIYADLHKHICRRMGRQGLQKMTDVKMYSEAKYENTCPICREKIVKGEPVYVSDQRYFCQSHLISQISQWCADNPKGASGGSGPSGNAVSAEALMAIVVELSRINANLEKLVNQGAV
jgi:hypothetical protein